MKADAKTEAAVLAVMKEFAACYAKRDVRGVLALHAPDPDVIILTPAGKTVGPDGLRAMVERDFSQHTELWSFGWTSVSAAGPVAWVAADATLRLQGGGQEMTMVGLLTWVLQNRGGKWLIAQGHVSFPPPQ